MLTVLGLAVAIELTEALEAMADLLPLGRNTRLISERDGKTFNMAKHSVGWVS